MAKTTFTQSEHSTVKEYAKTTGDRYLKSLAEKMDKAITVSAKSDCITAVEFLKLARECLGSRLKEHPNPQPAWWSLTSNRLKLNGMTPDLCKSALANIKATWRGEIFIDVLVNSLARNVVVTKPKAASKGWSGVGNE